MLVERVLADTREGLRVVQALGLPVTPWRMALLAWLPEPLLVAGLTIEMIAARMAMPPAVVAQLAGLREEVPR